MDYSFVVHSDLFAWVILPLLIFCARIVDVSMGTIRIIFVSRGLRTLAPILGFFEISIWLMAIGQIMRNLDNPLSYIAYAGGFAMGNFVGMTIEDRLSIGTVVLRIITKNSAEPLVDFLKKEHYGVTTIDGDGAYGKVKIIFSVIGRQDIPRVVEKIQQFNPHAFYSIEDVRHVNEGVFPVKEPGYLRSHLPWFRQISKGK
ncbi:MAG: DUF2179 domain-containing protein [Methanomicrobiales archaeon]|nr:DUF2179 domain-containing protein [Methanomicrobiales archaeon]MDI6876937.1 DUF2179 domain-containing protein [Methanomicrobiales archaeon]